MSPLTHTIAQVKAAQKQPNCKVSKRHFLIAGVKIKPNGNGNFMVNSKNVFLNMDNQWVAQPPLNHEEHMVFLKYITSKIVD